MKSFSLLFLTGVLAARVCAQPVVPTTANLPDKDTPGASARLLDEVRTQLARGRTQLDSNQTTSVETLRSAAQKSLNALVTYIGPQILTAAPEEMPTTGFTAAAVRQAADAHYWWGRAADQFGRRDEALAAYARATRFAGQLRGGSNSVARDSLLALGGVLREGLPLIAPDDTLETIAEIVHGKLWTPLRFSADFSNLNFDLRPVDASPLALRSGSAKHEFLITSGRLYPPVPSSAVDVSSLLSRVPPLYRTINADALPEVLKLDRMAIGYEREAEGPNKGLWRQAVRVFYASTYLTRDQRDDRARAEALCAQFLKTRALFKAALGTENPYAKDGITTLWLSEVSSWWPKDDDDPRVRSVLGSQMPKINVRTSTQTAPTEIDLPSTTFPWRAAAQIDSYPGEIMFFKMTAPREEAEWLRETMHEYGHVVLPAFDGFKPPLEPYGNGLIGETLGMLWIAADPASWSVPSPASTRAMNNATLPAVAHNHVVSRALAALNFWRGKGPVSALRRDGGAQGVQYLQGLSVYIERVYGPEIFGKAFSPLVEQGANAANPLARLALLNADSLLASFPNALRAVLGTVVSGNEIRILVGQENRKTFPIWLGGAMDAPNQAVDELISRAPLKLANEQRISGWLYVPASASTLRVEWQSPNRNSDALSLDTMKTTPVAPLHPDAVNAFKLDVKARSGWQKFTFLAHGEVTVLAAQFEK